MGILCVLCVIFASSAFKKDRGAAPYLAKAAFTFSRHACSSGSV